MNRGRAAWNGALLAATLGAIAATARAQPQTPPHPQTPTGIETETPATQPPPARLYGYCIASSLETSTVFLSDVVAGLTAATRRTSERRWREYLGIRITAADGVACQGGFRSKTLDYENRDAAASQLMRSQSASQRVYTGWSG